MKKSPNTALRAGEFCFREEQGKLSFRGPASAWHFPDKQVGGQTPRTRDSAIRSHPCCTVGAKAVVFPCLLTQGLEAHPLEVSHRWLWGNCPSQC